MDLGALERAVRANFCVFEKSLLKLIWIIGKYKYRGELIVHSFKSRNTFEGPWGGLQTKEHCFYVCVELALDKVDCLIIKLMKTVEL